MDASADGLVVSASALLASDSLRSCRTCCAKAANLREPIYSVDERIIEHGGHEPDRHERWRGNRGSLRRGLHRDQWRDSSEKNTPRKTSITDLKTTADAL